MSKAVWFGFMEPTEDQREGARLRGDEICAVPEGMALGGLDLSEPEILKRAVAALRNLCAREGSQSIYFTGVPTPIIKLSWDIVSQAVECGDGFPGMRAIMAPVTSGGKFLRWEVVGAI